jgi:hypothetical protein
VPSVICVENIHENMARKFCEDKQRMHFSIYFSCSFVCFYSTVILFIFIVLNCSFGFRLSCRFKNYNITFWKLDSASFISKEGGNRTERTCLLPPPPR